MSKHVVASFAALMLIGASGAMAQESDKMKGPPNANGMSNSESSSGSMKSGESGNANGAASAKATGEDKK
jgi:hypothetical protein